MIENCPVDGCEKRELMARIETLKAALRPFIRHYEKWMEERPSEENLSIFPLHSYGELKAARAALAPEQDK